jgi:hypothetical protein
MVSNKLSVAWPPPPGFEQALRRLATSTETRLAVILAGRITDKSNRLPRHFAE